MTKKIEDYLHLYMGCEVEFGYEDRKKRGQLIGKTGLGWQVDEHRIHSPIHAVRDELIKPILRPLADMNLEEGKFFDAENEKELGEWKYQFGYFGVLPPDDFHYLLSRHFDLFGLIDAGLAIDKTNLV